MSKCYLFKSLTQHRWKVFDCVLLSSLSIVCASRLIVDYLTTSVYGALHSAYAYTNEKCWFWAVLIFANIWNWNLSLLAHILFVADLERTSATLPLDLPYGYEGPGRVAEPYASILREIGIGFSYYDTKPFTYDFVAQKEGPPIPANIDFTNIFTVGSLVYEALRTLDVLEQILNVRGVQVWVCFVSLLGNNDGFDSSRPRKIARDLYTCLLCFFVAHTFCLRKVREFIVQVWRRGGPRKSV